jgi:hypothetical protein
MVSFEELRDCEPMVFSTATQRWQQLAGQVADRVHDQDEHIGSLAGWESAAGDAAKATLGDERAKNARRQRTRSAGLGPLPSDFGAHLGDLREKLRQVLNTARDNQLEGGTVVADGTVASPLTGADIVHK